MIHKSFMDIKRLQEGFVPAFNKGDYIVIQEKIDGANCAIRYDSETDSVVAQSRKNILNIENNLRGFYEWTQTLNKDKIKRTLGDNLILFGEWLVPHSVEYPEDKYNHAYFYDIYDTDKEMYLSQLHVKLIVDTLGLTYAPVFYIGDFVSWEECIKFVGKTHLGGEYGEGIVVKNQTRLNDTDNRKPFYVKIVGEKFSETKGHKVKKIDPEKIKNMEENRKLAETIVTKARVGKLLNKFVDEGILPEDWGATDMPIIAKNLGKAVYEDCMKEEPETVKQVIDFGKTASVISMKISKKIMEERSAQRR